MNKRKLKAHLQPAEESVVVKGQESMLRTLFSNLLDNAIKYTPAKGNIWIKVLSSDSFAVISIRDNGIGISKEKQEKIFDRFYRIDTSRSKTKGFGLGLSISKSIAEMHSGKITVKSTPGKGSTFTVYLPRT